MRDSVIEHHDAPGAGSRDLTSPGRKDRLPHGGGEPGGGVAARLIVLGRQGAGKGTQCVRLADRLGISHLSTGDLFRAEIASGSALGRELQRYVLAGDLVPDDVVLDVVATKLGGPATRAGGYLLDGFPRTLAQGQALFEVLGAGAADLAVELDVPREIVARRLTLRRVCGECGVVTAVDDDTDSLPCMRCGGRLERRADDHPEVIAHRLALYEEEATPLLVWLDQQGILVTVDGEGDPDDVHDRLFDAVAQRIPAVREAAAS
jgi:adenylate kinase